MSTNFPANLDSYTTKVTDETISETHINDPQDAIEAIEAKVGIDNSADTTSLDYKVNNFFTTGRALLFYEDSAPTGWTIQNTLDDKLVFVTKGSAAGGQTGGTAHTTGTWTIGGITNSDESSHTHTGGAHTHAQNMGSASANIAGTKIIATSSDGSGETLFTADSGTNTVYAVKTGVQSGGAVSTSAGTAHTHTISSDATWRPAAYNCIICTKD